MANRLEIELGAEIKEFQSKLAKALKGFDQLKSKEKELTKSFKAGQISQEKYYDALAKNSTDLIKAGSNVNKYKKAIQGTDAPLKSFSKGAANGSSAMTAFSRTVQDAPFGLMGVSNNITNLTEQFGYLKKRTGSSGSALKAMLRDLKGFGGITLGISAITSLLLVFGDKLEFAASKTKEFTDALANVSSKGIVEFQTLTDVMLDNNATQKEQSKALSILKEKYTDFDTSLLTTKGNYEKSKIAIDAYIGSLVQQAKAQAALTLIQEKQSKILALEEEKALKIKERFGVATVKEAENQVKQEQAKLDRGYDVRQKRLVQNADYALNNLKDYNKSEIDEITEQISVLTNLANVKDLVLFGGKNKPKGKTPETGVSSILDGFKKDLVGVQDVINSNPLDLSKIIPVEGVNVAFNENMNAVLLNAQMKAQQFTQGINNVLGSSIANTFSNLGESLGTGLKNVNQVITGGLGSLLSSMGDYLIQAGTAAVLAGTITKLFGSIEGVGAGFAAIAGGVLLKGIGSSISNFGGAGETGNSNAGAGSSFSGGSNSFQNGVSGQQTVQFVLRGQDLYGSFKNYVRGNNNLGATITI